MRKVIWQALLVLVGGIFFYAGISKLLDPVEFGRSIQRYQIIGHPFSLVAALWVPWAECIAGAALFFKRWRSEALVILLGLLLIFELILGSAYYRGLDIDCGCFGKGFEQSVTFAFLRNLGLITMCLLLLIANRKGHEGS